MGCPDIYYKKALRWLAFYLAFDEDGPGLSLSLRSEKSTEKLEKYILDQRTKIGEKFFLYYAGAASQRVFDEAYQEGNDAANASVGGLNEFEHFIGLLDNEED